jgi:hypothetical protein
MQNQAWPKKHMTIKQKESREGAVERHKEQETRHSTFTAEILIRLVNVSGITQLVA